MEKVLEQSSSSPFSTFYSTFSTTTTILPTSLDTNVSLTLSINSSVLDGTRVHDSMMNSTGGEEGLEDDELEYIFDRLYVRVIFILLYTIVFILCFFGNLLVILVVTLHWKMRNITKFCLGNLAIADLCVGVFCVYQNLSTYLINSWIFGQYLCKLYHFINSLSHTASILILVVICVERYLAILHPFKCKQLLTIRRLRLIIVAVWLASAVYSAPKLYYIVTVKVLRMDGEVEIICTAKRTLYDSRTFDMIHFFLLFLLPLLVISILYTRVGLTLWRSSKERLPWIATNSCSTNLSRSSSGTINEESPTNSRPPSIRMRAFRDEPEQSLKQNSREDAGHYFTQVDDFPTTNVINTPPPPPPLTTTTSRPNLNGIGIQNSPTFTVTAENKCYLVESNEMNIVHVIETEPAVTFSESVHNNVMNPTGSNSMRNNHNQLLSPPVGGYFTCERPSGVNSIKNNNSPLNCQSSLACSMRRDGSKRRRTVKRSNKNKNLRGGRDALKGRMQVIRMLVCIVSTFAICNFPVHLRKMFQYWWPQYDYGSIYSTLAAPVTTLIMLLQCGLNPLIYAFLSRSFRESFKDLLCCRWKKPFQASNLNNFADSTTHIVTVRSMRAAIRDRGGGGGEMED